MDMKQQINEEARQALENDEESLDPIIRGFYERILKDVGEIL
jgi:hypothetical protein